MASDSAWPVVGWEEYSWRLNIDPDLISRRLRNRHSGPYRAAVVPAIAQQEVALPSTVIALADAASNEISRFDVEVGLQLSQFTALLLRSESASSSQIENLISSARAIALAELDETDRSNAVEIVANVHAMQAAIALADTLNGEAILAMHRVLMGHQSVHASGEWRSQQVWIGGSNFGPHEAFFVPPNHRYVPDAIADLVAFIQRDDIPVLIHAALAHAQFETIHPFTGGNGRTGRALLQAMLRGKDLTRQVTVPISAGLLTNVDAYFSAITAYQQGDLATLVTLVSEASLAAIANGRQLVRDLSEIRQRWTENISARRDSLVWQLVDLLVRQPVVNAEIVQQELGASSANVHRALRQLVDAGVITEFSGKQRHQLGKRKRLSLRLTTFRPAQEDERLNYLGSTSQPTLCRSQYSRALNFKGVPHCGVVFAMDRRFLGAKELLYW